MRLSCAALGRQLLLLLLLLLLLAGLAQALQDQREQEIAQCLPGEAQTWGDGRDGPSASAAWLFVYEGAGAPAWLDERLVLQLLQRAAQGWAPCGLPVQIVAAGAAPRPDPAQALVRVQWSDAGARGNFGLADVGRRSLSLGPAAFALLRQRNPAHPAAQTLQMVIAHEMGHFLGLMAHSRRCVDVMSYYHDGRGGRCSARDDSLLKAYVEYRSALPTACDLQRCRAANGR